MARYTKKRYNEDENVKQKEDTIEVEGEVV